LSFELSPLAILNYSILNCDLIIQNSKLKTQNRLCRQFKTQNSKLKIGFADNSKLKIQNSKLKL